MGHPIFITLDGPPQESFYKDLYKTNIKIYRVRALKDLYIYLPLVCIILNRKILAAFNITLRKCRARNCARKIWMPVTLTCLELYTPNANIYTCLLTLYVHCTYIHQYLNFITYNNMMAGGAKPSALKKCFFLTKVITNIQF